MIYIDFEIKLIQFKDKIIITFKFNIGYGVN